VADLVERLMKLPDAVAVARVSGETTAAEPARSELPLLIYYRGSIKADDVRALGFEGEVSPPGAWGRLLNGGASLEVENRRVELFYRDLEVVEHWVAEATEGRYERDEVDSWVAGMPTYLLAGELATAEALAGELSRPEFPDALRESAPRDWERVAARALEVAEGLAARGDVAACTGLLAKAAVAAAQALLAGRGEWALSEAYRRPPAAPRAMRILHTARSRSSGRSRVPFRGAKRCAWAGRLPWLPVGYAEVRLLNGDVFTVEGTLDELEGKLSDAARSGQSRLLPLSDGEVEY